MTSVIQFIDICIVLKSVFVLLSCHLLSQISSALSVFLIKILDPRFCPTFSRHTGCKRIKCTSSLVRRSFDKALPLSGFIAAHKVTYRVMHTLIWVTVCTISLASYVRGDILHRCIIAWAFDQSWRDSFDLLIVHDLALFGAIWSNHDWAISF